jgi:pilus assembly protein CpaF
VDGHENVFDIAGRSLHLPGEMPTIQEMEGWWQRLEREGKDRLAAEAGRRALSPRQVESLARQVFAEVAGQALSDGGVRLGREHLLRLIGELSGLGPLLELVARPQVEDIAVNLGHLYVYTTGGGWQPAGEAPDGVGDALRVLVDRAAGRSPTPDHPIADAMLQVVVPDGEGGVERKGLRVSHIMPPASPYGDVITLRVSRYAGDNSVAAPGLGGFFADPLPPVTRPQFSPRPYPRSQAAANYLLSVMVHGGVLVIAGATGTGKTYLARCLLQEMLSCFPPGAVRLFLIEDSNEIVLCGWDGDPQTDTGNVVYTVTRPEVQGGPPPVTMFDLARAALRARPDGIVIGEARGAEAWELVRAAATGHGRSAFTLHATGAEDVWMRFLQVVQAHPDVRGLSELQIAQGFAEAVTAVAYLERGPRHGQAVREVVEVQPMVERAAARPSFLPLFRFDPGQAELLPTGYRPLRPGFRPDELDLPEEFFKEA